MSILFINGSPHKKGVTVALATQLLAGRSYEVIHLVDKKINFPDQRFEGDEFEEVIDAMRKVDTIVMGSPVYWHNMSGILRNLLDRCHEEVGHSELTGKRLFMVYQGIAPEDWMIEDVEYTISRFAMLYGMEYMGMIKDKKDADQMSRKL